MKSNNCQENILAARVRTAIAAMAMSMVAAASAQAAPTSFPQYPLLTGGEAIPPNIMLILDDSGSMEAVHMPTDRYSLSDLVRDRSYINNTLYYNPDRDYKPWRKASVDLDDRFGNANFRSVSSSTTSVSNGGFDLRDQAESYFYIPKAGVSNPGTNSSNYDKYRIASSSSANSYNGGVVQKQVSRTDVILSGTVSLGNRGSSACFAIPVDGVDTVTLQVSGSRNADLYVFSNSSCANNSQLNSDTGNNNTKSLSVNVSSRSWVYLQIRNASNSNISNISYSASVYREWEDATPARTVKDKDGNVLPPRAQADELQNFANWYHYHRSRNKMAKAGASEAFGRLGKNYRVGFDTIWNRRNGNTVSVRGSVPAFPIPTATNDGLFESANRSNFYDSLQAATANGNTPLHGALQRAGRYFQTDAPWKDSSGNMLSCRQNYALLTTDGYWNQADSAGGYSPAVGNSDLGSKHGDAVADTLADVAYEFWKKDLRADLGDNVRPTGADPATWQHMVTFGISIGLQGTLDPNQEPPAAGRWPNPITNSGAARIDDLWHASLNGHGSFVVATDTDKFAAALTAALSAIDSRSASGSNIASSSTKTESSTLTFVAGFTSVSWIGDLIASPFNAALTGVSDTPLWALSKTFGAGGVNSGFADRTVLTSFGGTAQQFTSSMPSAGVFARSGTADAVSAADNIDYLRGDQSREEGRVGGVLRKRAYPLGDIVDSSPSYVEDTNTVYVGANDGMLHGIRATDGKVLFSYVPKGLDFEAMAGLSAPSYEHRYFVDGQMDVINRVNQGSGRNILVGALGRGGRGVFALNVTNPASMGASNVLWDDTFQTPASGADPDRDMGYVFGAVRIRKGNGGKTYALVPNGIDSPNGSATLYAYELAANGAVTRKHTLIADAGTGNGLMSTGMADFNGDGLIDVVYGGDLKGNVWRWDFEGTNPGAAVKLFQAKDAGGNPQPITGGLAVGRDTSGQVFVGFGTGKFISNGDVPAPGITSQTQSIYGIIDTGATIAARSQLEARTIPFSGKTAKGEDARGFENYSVLPSSKQGWYIDLPVPERVTSAPTVYGSAMYLASVIPATGADCSGAAGSGFVNALNLFTGTSPKSGGYFTDQTGLKDKDGNPGVIGSVGISGGMPTEVNVTSSLATVGTGQGPSDLSSGTSSSGINPPTGGRPSRISWREIVAQ
jgi:type IV pilus assembly protein PilY1